jgi:sterol desaturase/sphingolipid hydroxylase (fatty acid hydroxylase superfamily)
MWLEAAMRDVLDPWLNPVTWAVPFFLLFIGIELAALKWLDHDDVSGYQARDASTSILMGLGSLVSTVLLKAAAFFVYIALYLYVAPWHLPMRTWWSWALVLLGVDLAYYWQHRFVHRVRVGWAAHQAPSHHRVHHGSDPIYLDRNYAGILIVWDRMFGTFQPELFRPSYGLTHPVDTYNLVKLQYGHYADLWHDVRQLKRTHVAGTGVAGRLG